MTLNIKRVITSDEPNIAEFNALNADLRAEKGLMQAARADIAESMAGLQAAAAGAVPYSTLSAFPAANLHSGKSAWATDTGFVYLSNGVAWVKTGEVATPGAVQAAAATANNALNQVAALQIPLVPIIYAEKYGFSPLATAAGNDTALLNAYNATSVGGILEVRPGTYNVTNALTVNKAVSIRSNGATLVASAANKHTRFTLNAPASIEGFVFDGAAGAGAVRGYLGGTVELKVSHAGARILNNTFKNAIGIGVNNFGGATDVTVAGNQFEGTFHAVFVEPDGAGNVPQGWNIDNNTAKNLKGSAVCGIKIKSTTAIGGRHRITNNRLTGGAVDGAVENELGIELQGGGATQTGSDHSIISGNVVEGWHFGVSVDSSRSAVISNNTLKANLYANIELAAAMGASVTGNACDGRNAAGTVVTKVGIVASNLYAGARTEGNVISANSIIGAKQVGIKIQDTMNPVVTGNSIRPLVGCTGIEVLQSDFPLVSANNLVGASNSLPALVLNCASNVAGAVLSNNVLSGVWQKPLDIYFSAAGQTADGVVISNNSLKATFATGLTVTGAGTLTKVAMNGNVGTSSMEGNWIDWAQRLGTVEGVFPPNNNVTAGEGSIYLDNYNAGSGRMWVKRSGGISNTGWQEIPRQAAAQVDSTAADLAGLKADFNALLLKLRTTAVLAP